MDILLPLPRVFIIFSKACVLKKTSLHGQLASRCVPKYSLLHVSLLDSGDQPCEVLTPTLGHREIHKIIKSRIKFNKGTRFLWRGDENILGL